MRFFLFSILVVIVFLFFAIRSAYEGVETRPKDDLVIAIENEPPHLNPAENPSYVLSQITYLNWFEPLFTLTPKGEILPLLAEFYRYDPDKMRYFIQLRKSIFFHDGSKLTARKVRDALYYLKQNPKHPHPEYYEAIDHIELEGENALNIYLKRPNAFFLYYLTRPVSVIIDPQNILNGTGPYYFKKWERSQAIFLERNKAYWRENPSNIQHVTYKIVRSPQTQLLYLRNQQVDIILHFDKQAFLPLLENQNDFSYRQTDTDTKVILVFNQNKPALKIKENRRFLTQLVKKLPLKEAGFFGDAPDIYSHFSIFHKDAVLTNPYLKADNELIKPDHFPEELTLTLPPFGYAKNSAEIIALALKQYGVKLHIVQLEWGEWLQRTYQERDFDLTIIASMALSNLSNYGRKNYYYAYQNEAFNKELEAWHSNLNAEELSRNLQKLQQILMEDYANIFLFQLPILTLYQKNIVIGPIFNASYFFELRKVSKK